MCPRILPKDNVYASHITPEAKTKSLTYRADACALITLLIFKQYAATAVFAILPLKICAVYMLIIVQ